MSSDTETEAEIWSSMSLDFEIVGARIVATLGNDGGAIVEKVRRLHCSEGRLYSYESRDEGEVHSLDYAFSFSGGEEGDPLASRSVKGRIVIAGHHTNGHRLEIRGTGWIGYDEAGIVGGRFDAPPVIITDDCDPEPQDVVSAEPEETGSLFDFPMPPQFLQATVRVPSNEWDDLDDE